MVERTETSSRGLRNFSPSSLGVQTPFKQDLSSQVSLVFLEAVQIFRDGSIVKWTVSTPHNKQRCLTTIADMLPSEQKTNLQLRKIYNSLPC